MEKVTDCRGRFCIHDQTGKPYRGKHLILATGLSETCVPDFSGGHHCENYAGHDTDDRRYTNKCVLLVGTGNSAFETAHQLTENAATINVLSLESVKMAWQTHYVGNLRAVNNNFLDTYQLKSQNAALDA